MNEIQTFAAFIVGMYCGFELCRWSVRASMERGKACIEEAKKTVERIGNDWEEFRERGLRILELERAANDLMVKISDMRAEAHDRRYQYWHLKAETQSNEYY